MRTTARLLTTAAPAVATTGLCTHTAFAGDFEPLEIFPSPAGPGATVTENSTACADNGQGVKDAWPIGAGQLRLSPGTHEEVEAGSRFKIPHGTGAGTYAISVTCQNGSRATGVLMARHHDGPRGHVRTGVGGSVGPDTTQIAAGVAVLAASAVGGILFLRRRASGAQDS
ncbi:hypothetical protein ACFYRC_08815 [Streptomyces sp. NPDC005279]|uniref:hypothetical protein n=1 Tax=Streptomyces sp. NPDC005279 TaxID=3364712 RepID=UPI0036BCFD7B